MTVESTIRNILQGKRLRKESRSISLKEALAEPVSARMQRAPGADEASINQRSQTNTNTAAADNSRTVPPTQNTGTKAGDNSSTNQNPSSSQNSTSNTTSSTGYNSVDAAREKAGLEQEKYNKEYAAWEAKYGERWRAANPGQDPKARQAPPTGAPTGNVWTKEQAAQEYQNYQKGLEAKRQAQTDAEIRAREAATQAGREVTAAGAISASETNDFAAVEAARAKAQKAREMSPASKYEGPTRLSPEELARKRGITPEQVNAEREDLRQKRMELDRTRPTGQPASFTPTGESPEQGKRADGTPVGPYTAPKDFSPSGPQISDDEREVNSRIANAQVGFGGDSINPQPGGGISVSNVSGAGIAGAGINQSDVQQRQFRFTNRRESFISFSNKEQRKRMISEAIYQLFVK